MKKFVVVCCCVLAVCVVLGLNARLEYSQIKRAMESVGASSDVVKDDIEALHVMSWIIENYDISNTLAVDVDDYNLIVTINPEPFYDPDTGETFDRVERIFYFETMEQAEKIAKIIRPMTWKIGLGESYGSSWIIGAWNSTIQALGSVVYVLGVIVSLIMFILWFLLDSVSTAWTLVQACIYILGFNVTI